MPIAATPSFRIVFFHQYYIGHITRYQFVEIFVVYITICDCVPVIVKKHYTDALGATFSFRSVNLPKNGISRFQKMTEMRSRVDVVIGDTQVCCSHNPYISQNVLRYSKIQFRIHAIKIHFQPNF